MDSMVNIYEAKTNFSKLLARVMIGEEIIIAKSGKPVARLVPIKKKIVARKPGSAKGQIVMADDFDDPLPTDIVDCSKPARKLILTYQRSNDSKI